MPASRLFGAYIVVDWSAAEGRKTGDGSVWIGVVRRDVRFRPVFEAHNPATRSEAEALLRTLSTTKPPPGATDVPPEFRRTERATRGKGGPGAKSVWQMHGAGVVGGQTILGIAAAQRLLVELGDAGAVWPFSFGWRTPTADDLQPLRALLVEVYPSLFPIKPEPGEVKDRAQVRETAEHLARLDETGRLGALFAPQKGVADEDVTAVEREEGWILGA